MEEVIKGLSKVMSGDLLISHNSGQDVKECLHVQQRDKNRQFGNTSLQPAFSQRSAGKGIRINDTSVIDYF